MSAEREQSTDFVRPMRYFIDGVEVSEAVAKRAESRGAALVARGGSGVVPEELRAPGETEADYLCAWIQMHSYIRPAAAAEADRG